jgi:hypothetical protein
MTQQYLSFLISSNGKGSQILKKEYSVHPRVIAAGMRVPYVWYDQLQPLKKLVLTIEGKEKPFLIDKIFTKELPCPRDTVRSNYLSI